MTLTGVEYLQRAKECKEEMKNGGEQVLGSLMDYLRKKKDRLTCFALRKILGLRNSSNRVEKANDILVSQKQREGAFLCSDGIFAVSQVTMVFKNEEALSYYKVKGVFLQPPPDGEVRGVRGKAHPFLTFRKPGGFVGIRLQADECDGLADSLLASMVWS